MNAKRQTIWLVSMLSLMVVLSAYYLFTEDVSKIDVATIDGANSPQAVVIDMSADGQAASAATDKAAANQASAGADAAKAQQNSEADAKAIEQVNAQTTSASNFFTNSQMKRHEELAKQTEQLMSTITDSKQKPEAVVSATNELEKISGMQEKIEAMEEVLLKDFPQAIITQEGKNWKVAVQSQKLEKSQGVTIVDMVMKELGAAPENIKIQYIHP